LHLLHSISTISQEKEYEETLPGNAAKTSEYYNVSNIPNRFDKPGLSGFVP